jgi:hypothetical protein
MTDHNSKKQEFDAAAQGAPEGKPVLFKSERCEYREFGVYDDGQTFAAKHPELLKDIVSNDLDYLMSDEYPGREKLGSAIRRLPEYLCFLKTTCKNDFFFAAFGQSAGEDGVKRTSQKDVERFVLERVKNQFADPRKSYEFVVEVNNEVIGYVELFDEKPYEAGLQFERGIFISADHQAHGYGKEAIIALTDYAFKVLSVGRIFTMVDPNNTRSLNNIVHNSGGVHIGETESKYAHLDGGGEKRYLFHIYPDNFYAAVHGKGNQKYLINTGDAIPLPPRSGSGGAPEMSP